MQKGMPLKKPESAAWASVLEALMEAAASVLSADSLDDTLTRVSDRLHSLVPYDDLTVYAADHERFLLVPAFACGTFVDEVMADEFPLDAGVTGAALKTGEARNITDSLHESNIAWVAETPQEPEAFICVPLMVERRTVGALNVYRSAATPFTDVEFEVVKRFAVMAALAFDSARQREMLRRQAETDALTGLLNRLAFQHALERAIAAAGRVRHPVHLVVADVDHFKDINDSYGHAVGDQALVAVAAALRSALREGDIVGRLGGEEFGFLLPDTDLPTALAVTERVRDAVRDLHVVDHQITLSAGLAAPTVALEGADELFLAADAALYRAKRTGRNRTCCHAAAV
jgi:diguanylate cyclase (GGDEF)-like protein